MPPTFDPACWVCVAVNGDAPDDVERGVCAWHWGEIQMRTREYGRILILAGEFVQRDGTVTHVYVEKL